jgi:hypothetical protein
MSAVDKILVDNQYVQQNNVGGYAPPPPSSNLFLLSTGDKLLLSTGSFLELAG